MITGVIWKANNAVALKRIVPTIYKRYFPTSGVVSFFRQADFLHERAISPNQLKWKQLINLLIGSSRSETRLLDSMSGKELKRVLQFLSGAHCQTRRHETFHKISDRFSLLISENDNWNTGDMLGIARLYIEAALDVIDANARRFKAGDISECVTVSHNLLNQLFSIIYARNISTDEIPSLLFTLSVAVSKGWIQGPGMISLVQYSKKAVDYLLHNDTDLSVRIETLWAISRLVKLGLLDRESVDQLPVRRLISSNDLLRYRIGENFTCVDFAPAGSFHHLLQLEEAFTVLDLRESSIAQLVKEIIRSGSQRDALVAVDYIWWCALAECEVHPDLCEWVKACTGLSENDRWRCVNGASHIVEITKRRGNVVPPQLEYLISIYADKKI
jgi:hypothetical protein